MSSIDFANAYGRRKNMSTITDILILYNNLDVGHFVKAVQKLQSFYFDRKNKYTSLKQVCQFQDQPDKCYLSQERNAGPYSRFNIGNDEVDLHQTIKNSIIGGPSIIFNRHAKAGETYVRNNLLEPVEIIVGYDLNSLYLYAMDPFLPTGPYVRRR